LPRLHVRTRERLGNLDVETRIGAAIPGTVVLRGDRPAPELRKLEGYRADWRSPAVSPIGAI
jgi:hypothetical protein